MILEFDRTAGRFLLVDPDGELPAIVLEATYPTDDELAEALA